ncbi:MAG TPA: NAD-dependent epimerase/dehydratase family protein, partial [Flavobacteriales bacterium]|nr:NAD-dependent epimerase/dehydratase family protein [Flavobacteriales bacterium]
MKVVLTGATGFVGRHLIGLLLDEGVHVRVISRKQAVMIEGCEMVYGDISDKKSIEKAFAGIDVLIHLAAELKNEISFETTNITGVRNLCELVNQYGIKRVVHLSSVGVLGMQFSNKGVLVNEEFPCRPKNGYEKSKLESEKIWLNGLDKSVSLCILRPTNVFGDHHPRNALLGMFRHIKNGKTLFMNKNARVNYVYVKDLAYVIMHF